MIQTRERGISLPTLDDRNITRAVQYGDPTVGWGGDENLWCATDDSCCGGRGCDDCKVVVLGLAPSAEGPLRTYVMVTVYPMRDPGWRHTLLRKLRDGDSQGRGGGIDYEALMAKEAAEREYQIRQKEQAVAERLAAALERDFGPTTTGLSRRVFPVTGKVG